MIKWSYPFLEGATAAVTTGARFTHRKALVCAGWGNWASGTAKLQSSVDGGTTWADVTDSDLTADGSALLTIPAAAEAIRAVWSGGTTAVTTGVEGNDNAITWTPLRSDGQLYVALIDPEGNDAELAITVAGPSISVSLATGAGGAITTTAAELMAAIEADAAASAVAAVDDTGDSDGSAAVVAETGSVSYVNYVVFDWET